MPRQPNGAGPGEFLYTPELTAPFTWAAGDQINVTGLYQVL